MKKLLILSSLLFVVGCSNGEEEAEGENVNSESEEVETTEENKNTDELLTQAALEGTYDYTDKEKTTVVSFEEGGTMRMKDGDDKRYHVNEEYGRVVINSEYFRVEKTNSGYQFMSIDKDGKRTHNDFELENQE